MYVCAQKQISGIVSDQSGNPIPGVNVAVKGTTTGTISDFDGKYVLEVPSDATTLAFSFVGMKNQDVAISGKSVINVVMETSEIGLDEVVVVGYGKQLKTDLTGSIAKVSTEDIKNIPAASFESTIQGKTAGVFVESGSGKVGQGIKMRIRGSSSISASNQPLYVVDGMPVTSQSQGEATNEDTNPLADINPADIESIQILKDASAAAIYGSRASNGVVLITTKKGVKGKTTFGVNYLEGISNPSNKVEFCNAEEYLQLMEESYRNVSEDGTLNSPIYDGWYNSAKDLFDDRIPGWDQGYDTDWQDKSFRSAKHRQFDISARGGSEKTTFYTGISYLDQEGILMGNNYGRISGRANINHKASDKLSLGANFAISRSTTDRVSGDRAFSTPLQLIALPPVQPSHDPETGEINTNTVYENGLMAQKYNSYDTEVYRNLSNLSLNYDIIPSLLSFHSDFGLDLLFQREKQYQGRKTNDGGPDGYAFDRRVTVRNYTSANYFTLTKSFQETFNLEAVAGMSFQEAYTEIGLMEGRGFPSDDFKRLESASQIVQASSEATGYSYLSYFVRTNFKAYDRFLLSLSGRIDGSSRFGADNRYGFFPAASVGWIVSNESFLKNSDKVSFLKFRLSYGKTGNSEIDDFNALGLYQGSNYAGLAGLRPESVASPDLKWETTNQIDFGIDYGFLNNRITGEIDYYVKKTTDLLLDVNVSATSGFESVTKNLGKLENKGFEFILNTHNFVGNFKWTTSFNVAHNKNEITDLKGQIISAGDLNRAMEGEPIGIFWGKKWAGVNSENGDGEWYVNADSEETTNDIGEAEAQKIGDPNPKYIGGLSNRFSYKGFDLSVMFQFVYGNDIFNHGRKWQSANGDWFDNSTKDQLNYWTPENTNTNIPQPRFGAGNGYGTSSRQIFDGSYTRLKDITIGYNFPKSIAEKIKMATLRVYMKAINLYVWTDYPGWDPEVNSTDTDDNAAQRRNIQQGWDFYTAPQPRTITFGVNMTF